MHYINSKTIAGIIGVGGFKVIDTTYIKDESINYFYTRYDCEITELITKKRPRLREMIVLANHNIEKVIKYEHVINDDSKHVWINTSDFNKSVMSFYDVQTGVKFITSKIEGLEQTIERKELPLKILTLFEHFHWIRIYDENDLSFQYIIPEEGHEIAYGIINEIISTQFK